MYKLDSGIIALREQIRRKALPPPQDQIPIHQIRATELRIAGDATIQAEARKRQRAARMLVNEVARKREEAINEKIDQFGELKQDRERQVILRNLSRQF